MLGLRRLFAGIVLQPISDHPLRAAGGVFAVAAAVVTWLGVTASATSQSASATGTVTLTAVVDYAAAHPAYPAAVLVGLAVLLLAD